MGNKCFALDSLEFFEVEEEAGVLAFVCMVEMDLVFVFIVFVVFCFDEMVALLIDGAVSAALFRFLRRLLLSLLVEMLLSVVSLLVGMLCAVAMW